MVAPCSSQSTTHSLYFTSPLICSTPSHCCLPCSTCCLCHSTYCLTCLAKHCQSTSIMLSLSLCWFIALSTLPLSLGSLPLFQFPLCNCLPQHSGLSDCRLKTPILLAILLLSLSLLWPSIPPNCSTPPTRSSCATIPTICPGVDLRLEDTYHQQDPLTLHCLGQLPTPP